MLLPVHCANWIAKLIQARSNISLTSVAKFTEWHKRSCPSILVNLDPP